MRAKHGAEFKAKVVLATLRGEETVAEISSRYNVNPSLIHRWKSEVLGKLPGLFEQGQAGSKKETYQEAHVAELERKVGQLTLENDFLKKNWERSVSKKGRI